MLKVCNKINKDTLFEHEWLEQNDLFSVIKRNNTSGNRITVFVYNARSLSKLIDDIVSDDRIINNNIIEFMKIEMNPSDSTCKITKTFSMSILVTVKINFLV